MNHKILACLAFDSYGENVTSMNHTTKKIKDEKTDTDCFVLTNKNEQIVVFRGTQKTSIKDIKTDLKFKAKNGIHEGFSIAYNSIESELNCILDINKKTFFTGHSLGGALAILAYVQLSQIKYKTCVTFGSPRVFTSDLTNNLYILEDNIYRYEALGDPIPYLPLYAMGYRHIGHEIAFGNFFDINFLSLKKQGESHSMENYIKEFHDVF